MTTLPKFKPGPAPVRRTKLRRSNRTNLSALAYERLEEMIVSCTLRPGLFLSIQDLQDQLGIGRTPVHQAVSRLAQDTLITIRPRHGLQIAPIDLARERTLLLLRRDLERFVVRLATERANPAQRAQVLSLAQTLRNAEGRMTITAFNQLDLKIDQMLIDAAGEPFLAHTLRPLHTLFRRTGYIYHTWVRRQDGLSRSIACHLAVLDAVAAGRVKEAVAASDGLIAFSTLMFDHLGSGTDPALLDCNLEMRAAG